MTLQPLTEPWVDYDAPSQASTTTTLLLIALVTSVLLGMFVFALVRRRTHLARGRVATASVTLEVPPRAGHAVLRGVVETEGDRPAIAITILEEGREFESKGNYSHEWREISRDIRVEPFYLVLQSGTLVRVEYADGFGA